MKKLIIGLVIGLMLGMSTNAFAAIGDKVQAVFASFNYVVNGQEETIDSPVLVYEGVSYVRTTDISNMLGYDVTYKKDSRTIEFNNPDVTEMSVMELTYGPEPSDEPNPTATPIPTPLPTDENGNVLSTPTPDPNATPSPIESATPSPSPEPTATVTPTPTLTPKPDNTAQCQAIKDNYGAQIAMVGYEGGAEGPKRLKILNLQNQMASALSSAGCN